MNLPSVAETPAPLAVPARGVVTSTAAGRLTRPQITAAAVFLAAHVVLGLVMRVSPIVSTLHAIATVLLAVAYTASTRRIRHVAMVVAYLAGCEVLWRMTNAAVFWEFGKYSIIVVLLVALCRIEARRNRALALVYLGLLVPSAALTFASIPLDGARQEIGFNLSGPTAIAAAIIFFSNIQLGVQHRRATFMALIGPATGIAAISLFSVRSSNDLEFSNAANIAASGGFGPNQVSAMLGLAVMVLLLLALERQLSIYVRMSALVLAAAFAAQAALTFSRGGIGLAAAGTLAAMFVLMRGSRRGRRNVVIVTVLSVLIGVYVIEPRLEALTKGKISERYSNRESSGRDQFAKTELQMFLDHPLLGVGPGIGRHLRAALDLRAGASHTEYTRMLGEHGIFGVLALGCLVALWIRAIRQAGEQGARAIASAMVIWFGFFLAIYGTRIAAPAVVLGIAFSMRSSPTLPRAPVRRTSATS